MSDNASVTHAVSPSSRGAVLPRRSLRAIDSLGHWAGTLFRPGWARQFQKVILGLAGILIASFSSQGQELFNGRDLGGWRSPAGSWTVVSAVRLDPSNRKTFQRETGGGILINGPDGKTSNLMTTLEHGDVEAHLEFCVPEGSNSGVYFMGRYEVQILDSWGVEASKLKFGDCGGLYASCSGEPKCYEGKAPPLNASKPPGEWQTFDVVFRAPRFDVSGRKTENARFLQVLHNGRLIHEDKEVTCPTCAAAFEDEKPKGPLLLQGDHGPVAYRNLRLKPVNLP